MAAAALWDTWGRPETHSQGTNDGNGEAVETEKREQVRFESGPQSPDFSLLDALYHPGETTPMHSVIAAVATERVREIGGSLSEAEMDAVLAEAGWPVELWGQAKAVAWCESKWSPYAVGDGGNSLGGFQLWYGWFAPAGFSAEQAFDPVVNARVALYVYQVRGRWGGGGGWSCAAKVGVE